MPREHHGQPVAPQRSIAIVVARFNESITSRLLAGAVETLLAHGVRDEQIDVAWVPGAFEIPTVAARLAATEKYAAIVCLGAVVRGETTHDQHINRAVSSELAALGARSGLPVLFGVLTCDTLEQAIQRAGGNVGNKGSDCAMAALEMADLLRKLP